MCGELRDNDRTMSDYTDVFSFCFFFFFLQCSVPICYMYAVKQLRTVSFYTDYRYLQHYNGLTQRHNNAAKTNYTCTLRICTTLLVHTTGEFTRVHVVVACINFFFFGNQILSGLLFDVR